jgi:thioredoxin 2
MGTLRLDPRGVIVPCSSCGQQNRLPFDRLGQTVRCGQCHTDLAAPAEPVDVRSAAEFDAVVGQSRVPVLVDFWAEWCGPCRMVAPEVARVASRMHGRVLVVKVDTEAVSDLATRLGIRSIPMLAVFSGGREMARSAGAMPADKILAFVEHATT